MDPGEEVKPYVNDHPNFKKYKDFITDLKWILLCKDVAYTEHPLIGKNLINYLNDKDKSHEF